MYIVYRSVTRWNSAGVPSCQRLSFLFCASKQTAISKPFCTWRRTWRMLLALPFSMFNSIWCSKKFLYCLCIVAKPINSVQKSCWSLLHAVHFFIEPSFAETKGSLCRCGVKLGCGEHFRWINCGFIVLHLVSHFSLGNFAVQARLSHSSSH